ncbi:MAG TPA: AAA family ATPase [Nitrososphaeraceae archaeon]|nr:AAA family ATPase [Nitrososphaeraceae archaeon]
MWSEVYRPAKIQDMVGNEEARIIVAKWLLKWIDGSKPLLLIGPPGVGKTTIIKALASQYNYDLIEMNASDTRNKAALTETILPILRNRSLVAEKTLLFLDEIDGISGRQDAGGMESLLTLIKEPTVPIVMASNTKDTKLKALAKLCKVVEFDNVHPSLLLLYLDQILERKGIDMQFKDKINLIKSAKGDIRSLLNIVQAKISGYDAIRDSSSVIDVSQVIADFFTSPTLEGAKQILMRVDGGYSDPRFGQSAEERRKDILYAFFSSIITSDIEPRKTAEALNVLSKCDVIVGRVYKDRHWSLLKYIDDILSYGLFSTLAGQKVKYNQYSLPWPISAPIIARRLSLREILVNLAHRTHTSVSVLSATYFPYLLNILPSQKVDLRQFVEGLGLDPKTAESLLKEITSLRIK